MFGEIGVAATASDKENEADVVRLFDANYGIDIADMVKLNEMMFDPAMLKAPW